MIGPVGFMLSLVASPLQSGHATPVIERTSESVVERAVRCGLGPATLRYEGELQSDILAVPHAAAATDTQLRCLDEVTGFGIFVELPGALQSRFDAIRNARASEKMRADAQDWLAKRGLLERVPKYVSGMTDDVSFTREVEQLCGPQTKGAFQSPDGPHTLNREWVMKSLSHAGKDDLEASSCLWNVVILSGYQIGIVGNEAYTAP